MMSTILVDPNDLWSPYIAVRGVSGFVTSEVISTSEASSALRATLINIAINQARGIVAAINRREITSLPLVVQSLDLETKGFITRRIVNMLSAFDRFLSDQNHADVREKLTSIFRPMAVWVNGQYCVTTPALLTIQTILYSHSEWFREHLFEAYSAARAFNELREKGFPKMHRYFIAALIAHQTLLRAAWSTDAENDPAEVLAFCKSEDDKVIWADVDLNGESRSKQLAEQAIGRGIALTLFPFIDEALKGRDSADDRESMKGRDSADDRESEPKLKRQLAATLVLHALCLYSRHHNSETKLLASIKKQALHFLDCILSTEGNPQHHKPRLVFLQYGRYVQQAGETNLFEQAKDHIRTKLLKPQENFTFCFQRVSTRKVWNGKDIKSVKIEPLINPENTGIWRCIKSTVGIAYQCHLERDDYLLAALNLELKNNNTNLQGKVRSWLSKPANSKSKSKSKSKSENSIKEIFKILLEAVKNKHYRFVDNLSDKNKHYCPTPLVGYVLNQMHDTYPQAFTALHIIARGVRSASSEFMASDNQITIWLPNYEPRNDITNQVSKCTNDHPNIVWNQNDQDPDLLISRYVAAMIINYAVSFAPREILLDYYSKQARNWAGIIEQALRENGWEVIEKYLEQVRCEPAWIKSSGEIDTTDILVNDQDRHKVACWSTTGNKKMIVVLGVDVGGSKIKMELYRLDLDNSSGRLSLNGTNWRRELTWENILQVTEEEVQKCMEDPSKGVKNTQKFMEKILEILGKCKDEFDCKAVGIAIAVPISYGVPTAISSVLAKFEGFTNEIAIGNPLAIHKMDFSKDLKMKGLTTVVLNDGEADIRDSEEQAFVGKEGVSVVLKEGTGVAFAVYVDGRPIGVLAETAKAILNLCCIPQQNEYRKRFPRGVLGEYCSKKGFMKLDVDGEKLGVLLKSVLIKSNENLPELSLNITEGTIDETVNTLLFDDVKKIEFKRCLFDIENKLQEVKKPLLDDTKISERINKTKNIADNFMSSFHIEKYSLLNEKQTRAIRYAWILGRWLADAIALTVDIYGAREIRLAGGPLSGKTGLFVTRSAEKALEEVYGFDLEVEYYPEADQKFQGEGIQLAYRQRELRRLKIVYPNESSGESGPRGVAKAAVDAFIREIKKDQLRICRDCVSLNRVQKNTSFSAKEVWQTCEEHWEKLKKSKGPWCISSTDVEQMLSREASVLGLARAQDGKFIFL